MTKVVLPGQNTAGQPNGYAALDGNSGLLVPAYLARTAQAAPAAPVSGFRDYVDSADGQHKTIDAAGTIRRIIRDYGVGTALPALTAGTSRGDVYTHSGLGCQFTWNGATWRQSTRALVTTEAQLAALATSYTAIMHDGVEVFAQDTKATAVWDATAGRFMLYDSAWQSFVPRVATGTATNWWTQGNGTAIGRYFRKGREISYVGAIVLGTTSTYSAGNFGTFQVEFPAGYVPSYALSPQSTFAPILGPTQIHSDNFYTGWCSVVNTLAAANTRRLNFQTGATTATASGVGWNISATNHGATWTATYETAFEA